MGFFGKMCEKKSVVENVNLVNNGYVKQRYKDILDINWKIIESSNEIEVVLEAKSENFLAMGFKPINLDR